MSQSLKMEMTALENSAALDHAALRTPLFGNVRRWLSGLLADVTRAMAMKRRQRRAIAELERLDDRLLKDIGISRSEIPFVVQHGRETSHGWL